MLSAESGVDPIGLLRSEVQQVLENKEVGRSDWAIVRVQVQLNPIDPFQWLRAQKSTIKLFWKGRSALESIAAVGCADEIIASELSLSHIREFHNRFLNAGQARYFGGIRFDTRLKPASEWTSFGTFRFFLPRFELVSTDDSAQLVCNLVLPLDKKKKWAILNEISRLKLPLPHGVSGGRNVPVSRLDQPEKPSWDRIIKQVINLLEEGRGLEKVVIARKVTFQFGEEIDVLQLFEQLTSITQHHFQFYFQFEPDSVFIGASPERLYKRDGRYIESEAIAGTGMRGDDGRDDLLFADALLESEKDQREHAFVRDSILLSMKQLCNTMQIDSEPSILNLNMGRHLRSKFWGMLRNKVSDIDILDSLHPTSAVGGHPTEKAMDAINKMEPFDRGWYAGPVGWIGPNSAEFSVAIRSALASGNSLSLFSGAGIVKGSIAEKEWLEVEQKNSDFLKVLGLDQRSIKY